MIWREAVSGAFHKDGDQWIENRGVSYTDVVDLHVGGLFGRWFVGCVCGDVLGLGRRMWFCLEVPVPLYWRGGNVTALNGPSSPNAVRRSVVDGRGLARLFRLGWNSLDNAVS